MKIWSKWDPGFYSEIYGTLSIDFGSNAMNKGIKIWNVERAKTLSIWNSKSYYIDIIHTFQELKEFERFGNLTLHGSVWERDNEDDDLVGDYNGDVMLSKSIFNEEIVKTYDGDDAYVTIKMKLTEISK